MPRDLRRWKPAWVLVLTRRDWWLFKPEVGPVMCQETKEVYCLSCLILSAPQLPKLAFSNLIKISVHSLPEMHHFMFALHQWGAFLLSSQTMMLDDYQMCFTSVGGPGSRGACDVVRQQATVRMAGQRCHTGVSRGLWRPWILQR